VPELLIACQASEWPIPVKHLLRGNQIGRDHKPMRGLRAVNYGEPGRSVLHSAMYKKGAFRSGTPFSGIAASFEATVLRARALSSFGRPSALHGRVARVPASSRRPRDRVSHPPRAELREELVPFRADITCRMSGRDCGRQRPATPART